MGDTIAIALSGGIDSMVAAALLKDQGRQVVGLHFLSGYEAGTGPDDPGQPRPTYAAIEAHARRSLTPLVKQLDIPLYIIDLRAEFQRRVVDYFVQTYTRGKTPNPCLVCNPSIKFDVLFEKARALGATQIATGHYARIEPAGGNRKRLLRGIDTHKEQSYFLARLTQLQLARAVLPLGGMTKVRTRRFAHSKGLIPAIAQESQDACFIKAGTYTDFLARHAPSTPEPGPIEDLRGRVIGRHTGLHRFTIGQRRGINCPAAAPYYVVRIDRNRNSLIVGGKDELLSHSCRVEQINWIAPRPDGPITVTVRIRYRHQAVPATLNPQDATRAEVLFDSPESAVTPGQGAVFYQNEEVLGGGWIA